jgi:hypothetical protein
MALDSRLLAVIARLRPEIYDGPHYGGPADVLERVALNPQPLPPFAVGRLAALRLLEGQWFATSIGAEFEPGDDICPPVFNGPFWWWLLHHGGPPPHGPEWLEAYTLGLVATLSVATAGREVSPAVARIQEKALSQLDSVRI